MLPVPLQQGHFSPTLNLCSSPNNSSSELPRFDGCSLFINVFYLLRRQFPRPRTEVTGVIW